MFAYLRFYAFYVLFVLFVLAKSFRKKNKKVWNCPNDLNYITTRLLQNEHILNCLFECSVELTVVFITKRKWFWQRFIIKVSNLFSLYSYAVNIITLVFFITKYCFSSILAAATRKKYSSEHFLLPAFTLSPDHELKVLVKQCVFICKGLPFLAE